MDEEYMEQELLMASSYLKPFTDIMKMSEFHKSDTAK